MARRYDGNRQQDTGWRTGRAPGADPYGQGGQGSDRPGRGRHGCVTALMTPFVLAARIQRPGRPDRLADPAIGRARVARTAIGLGATVWLFYAFSLRHGAKDVLDDKLTEMLISAAVLMVVGPLAVAAFVLAARPHPRALYRRRLRGPSTAFAGLSGGAALLWFALSSGLRDDLFAAAGDVGFLLSLLTGLMGLFMVPFLLASSVLCVHHSFRTADVHEVLPPLLSPVVVVVMSVLQAFDGPPVNAPQAVWFLFLAGAPLSVTALSWWELRRLRTRYGMTVRSALGR